MSSATAGLGSSPMVELIVRSLAGEINASGKRSLAGSGWNVIQPQRCLRLQRRREQIDLLIEGSWHDIDELNGPEAEWRGCASGLFHLLADGSRQRLEDLQEHVELVVRLGASEQIEPLASSPKTSGFDRDSPTASITGRTSCRLNGP